MRGRHSISYKPARENRGVQNETGVQSEAALASGRKTAQTILAPNDGCFRRVVRRDFLRLRKPARDDSKRESYRRPRDLPVRLTRGRGSRISNWHPIGDPGCSLTGWAAGGLTIVGSPLVAVEPDMADAARACRGI